MDAVVLLGGCDKTMPAELMAAASADVPAIALVVGPMSVGSWRGERLGACTDCRRLWADYRGNALDDDGIQQVNGELCPTAGTYIVMGTASTMSCLAAAMGMMLPYAASAPAVSGQRLRLAVATGRRAVEVATAGRCPSHIMTKAAFRNAITVLAAVSGSTNAIIHMTAIAARRDITLDLDEFHEVAARVPLLANCKPVGQNYLPDLHAGGGVPALLKALEPMLDTSALAISGQTLGDVLADAQPPASWQNTIRTLGKPLKPAGALVTLRGSLAPEGAVLKAAAASEHILVHEGIAAVFDSLEDVEKRLDDESLGLTPDRVIVMRNIGLIGAGMPEAGAIPIPRYLARQGVRDMVRISDGHMSGTAYGTIVPHCTPEVAIGGRTRPCPRRRPDPAGRASPAHRPSRPRQRTRRAPRRAALTLPKPPSRGWRNLYARSVQQASRGADLDFLTELVV
jgi:dihydroxy-acid dehydratase